MKIGEINEEYFGTDRSRNYLKDDYSRVLRGTIVRSILVELFVELSRERRNKRELPEGGTAYGDFDPDNAGFFANFFDTYQKSERMLLFKYLNEINVNYLSKLSLNAGSLCLMYP